VRTALDTNILSGLLAATPQSETIATHLDICAYQGSLHISPVVYAEAMAHPNLSSDFLKPFLRETAIFIDYKLEEDVWSLAGSRFAQHASGRRKASGEFPRRLIADFLIGAHTLAGADRLITYDSKFYRQNFPELPLYPLPSL